MTTSAEYTGANIEVLEGLKAVRKRPGMYIGNTDLYGLHHMVYELVDNSVDEALAHFADRIDVIIHPDSSVTVSDNGRGIPVDLQPQLKKSALEVVITVTFMADRTIFTTIDYNFDTLAQRFREMAYLTKGLTISMLDQRGEEDREWTFYFEGGIVSFVRHLNLSRVPLHPKPFYVDRRVGEVAVEVALQYNDS